MCSFARVILSLIKSLIENPVNIQIPTIIKIIVTIFIPRIENNLENINANTPPIIPPPTETISETTPVFINELNPFTKQSRVSLKIKLALPLFSAIKSQCIKVKNPIINKYNPNIFVVKKSGQSFFRNAYIPKINKSTKKGI